MNPLGRDFVYAPCEAKMKNTRGPIAVIEKSPRIDVKSSMVPMQTLGKGEDTNEGKSQVLEAHSASSRDRQLTTGQQPHISETALAGRREGY